MTEPTDTDRADEDRADEDRDISDVGLPGPGDGVRTDDAGSALGEPDVDVDGQPVAEAEALDEVFPPADGRS
jgi:hypothetical protein